MTVSVRYEIKGCLRGKYNYYEMKGINMQDNRYVQQSNVESESEVSEPKHVTSGKSTIGRLLFPRVAPSLQNRSTSTKRMANCTGRIEKGCELCAQISMVRRLKR